MSIDNSRDLADRVAQRAHETGARTEAAAETAGDKARDLGDRAAHTIENAGDKARELGDRAAHTIQDATEQVRDAAATAQQKAAELGSTAADKADAAMTSTGTQMKNLADQVRDHAPSGKVGDYATQAADALERGGNYLQDANVDAVRGDLESIIRKHPLESLLVGLGVGYLLARATRR